MKRRLRFSRHALGQLEEALAYIAMDDPAAASRLGTKIRDHLIRLKDFPDLGRVVPELRDAARREVIVVPFLIVYRLEGAEIRIQAVVHGRRHLMDALDQGDTDG